MSKKMNNLIKNPLRDDKLKFNANKRVFLISRLVIVASPLVHWKIDVQGSKMLHFDITPKPIKACLGDE